jgi:murein DD-endopeptidase MepM/ murein hydrolase activator NlpD
MSGFVNLRKKVRRRRMETMLLAGYAIAVTCALFVSLLSKNNETYETKRIEEMYDSDILTPAYNDNNPFELAFMQVNEVKLLSQNELISSKYVVTHGNQIDFTEGDSLVPDGNQAGSFDGIYQKERRVLTVSQGDSFIGLLTGLGMNNQLATQAYTTLKEVFDARKLKVGQNIELTATFDVKTKELETLDNLIIEPVRGTKYILQLNEYDKFEARIEQEKFDYDIKEISGTIDGIVSKSMVKAGLSNKMTNTVTQLFTNIIDFSRDVQKGDSFKVKYEVNKDSKGEVVSIGDIIFASFTLGKDTYKLYRYKNRAGEVDYYDEAGKAKKSGLDRKPLGMRNARISSLYGYRRHPIYKTKKFHSGVDYAAPKGTPVFASGSGVLELVRYVNGYGNSIKIRHNSEYQTFYAHMNGFASGMKPGVRVKKGQIIGYVGSTGRSTGPHLHFEILRKGQRIDPLKAKVATGTDLTGSQLAEFKRIVTQIDNGTATAFVNNNEKTNIETDKKDKADGNTVAKDTTTENVKVSESVENLIYPPKRAQKKIALQEAERKKIQAMIPTRKPARVN